MGGTRETEVTTTTMAADTGDITLNFSVLIKVRLDGHVCKFTSYFIDLP